MKHPFRISTQVPYWFQGLAAPLTQHTCMVPKPRHWMGEEQSRESPMHKVAHLCTMWHVQSNQRWVQILFSITITITFVIQRPITITLSITFSNTITFDTSNYNDNYNYYFLIGEGILTNNTQVYAYIKVHMESILKVTNLIGYNKPYKP